MLRRYIPDQVSFSASSCPYFTFSTQQYTRRNTRTRPLSRRLMVVGVSRAARHGHRQQCMTTPARGWRRAVGRLHAPLHLLDDAIRRKDHEPAAAESVVRPVDLSRRELGGATRPPASLHDHDRRRVRWKRAVGRLDLVDARRRLIKRQKGRTITNKPSRLIPSVMIKKL
jgi:hypothetical protein